MSTARAWANTEQNDALVSIVNAERRGKRQVLLRPSSKVVVKFLSVMQKHGTYSRRTAQGKEEGMRCAIVVSGMPARDYNC